MVREADGEVIGIAHNDHFASGHTVAARGYRGGAVAVRGGRYGYRGAYGYRGYGVGAAVGAAAVGAAATGAYYRSGCGYDAYGNWVCPNRYYPY